MGTAGPARTNSPLRIRLLGELEIARGDGLALPLPASKKTRALLGYLIATGKPHRRERLCDLLWDGPDDPRAELRWSLSKIRPLLDGGAELVADRQRVCIDLRDAVVDLVALRAWLGPGAAGASTEVLRQAAALFSGEFLDGLDLPGCYLFQEWCMAEREAVNRQRLAVLSALAERLHDHPDDALPYARGLVAADPLSESAHAAVIRLLARLGRHREAASQYEHARRTLEKELGVPPSEELESARRALQTVAVAESPSPSEIPSVPAPVSPPRPVAAPPVVGRRDELALVDAFVAATVRRRAADVLVIIGEAGIGKSHLLGCIAARMKAAGGSAWHARGFEPETGRPYGIWFDLLRSMNVDRPDDRRADPLAALVPEADPAALPGDRDRLFDAIHGLLRQAVAERPAAILLDDIQWIDETSCSLLHFIARGADDISGLLVVCAAREGEIDDNAAATGVLRSLARDGRIRTIGLGRLDAADTDALVRGIDPALEVASIFAQSGGNPLYALELAQAHQRGDSRPGTTMAAVVDGQIARLSERARETLLWAAVIGRAFTPDDLGRAAHMDAHDLFTTLGELERRGLLRPVGDEIYDFAHDIVRQAAYRSLSQPRRRLLHRCIMRAIQAAGTNDAALAADMAYHAALADEHETAARACADAGARALRLFANAEAAGFADRGLRYSDRAADAAAMVELRIELMRIRILAAAGPGMRPLPRLADALASAAATAESAGLPAPAATAHYLLSILHQEAGDTRRAQTSTLRAAAVGRAAGEATRAHQLANTARCLLELETEIARSRELIREADGIVGSTDMDVCELHWARGLLHRWDGEFDEAVDALAHALSLARRDQDRWREYKCLTWLAMLQQEMGRYADMRAHCAELRRVAKRLDEDETPFVAALQALALLGIGDPGADDVLADALGRLRVIDDKSHLAYVLNSAACQHIKVGRFDRVRLCAREALAAAISMRRKSEAAIARTLLAQVGEAEPVGATEMAAADPDGLNARARLAMRECLSRPPVSNGRFHGERPS